MLDLPFIVLLLLSCHFIARAVAYLRGDWSASFLRQVLATWHWRDLPFEEHWRERRRQEKLALYPAALFPLLTLLYLLSKAWVR